MYFCRENFIKDAGEIVDFWFTSDVDGRFKRFGQIELATGESAQKVCFWPHYLVKNIARI